MRSWPSASQQRGFFVPVVQALTVGVVFVGVLLIGYHAPHPHHARVDVVGSSASVRVLDHDVNQSEPGALDLVRVRSAEIGLQSLGEGRVFGVLTLASSPTLYVAGANGPAVTSALEAIFSHALALPGTSLHAIDALPLRPNDTSGLPLFYLVFGVVIASYLFALSSVSVGRRLSPAGHWALAALLALLLAGSSSAIARFGTQTIVAHATIVVVILFLLSLGVGAGTAMFLSTFRTFGATMATVVLVTLGSASGGLLPAPWLPSWLGVFRGLLPMGVALTGIQDAVYFGSDGVVRALVVLAAWSVVPVVLIAIAQRLNEVSDIAVAGPQSRRYVS